MIRYTEVWHAVAQDELADPWVVPVHESKVTSVQNSIELRAYYSKVRRSIRPTRAAPKSRESSECGRPTVEHGQFVFQRDSCVEPGCRWLHDGRRDAALTELRVSWPTLPSRCNAEG
jgi:hypothetical protein